MNDQPSSQATNVDPIGEQQSDVLNKEDWFEQKCEDRGERPILGFLQLCADRRFHKCIQDRFQKDAKLALPEDYWIHADAGGTPRMASQIGAPDYCYYDNSVRLMGWSAHGNKCGGFPGVGDDEIWRALIITARCKAIDYPLAKHFVYFATLAKDRETEETAVYCMVYEPTTTHST